MESIHFEINSTVILLGFIALLFTTISILFGVSWRRFAKEHEETQKAIPKLYKDFSDFQLANQKNQSETQSTLVTKFTLAMTDQGGANKKMIEDFIHEMKESNKELRDEIKEISVTFKTELKEIRAEFNKTVNELSVNVGKLTEQMREGHADSTEKYNHLHETYKTLEFEIYRLRDWRHAVDNPDALETAESLRMQTKLRQASKQVAIKHAKQKKLERDA